MYHFSAHQRKTLMIYLCCFHIFIIAASNYLVMIPVSIFGHPNTLGTFTFPFIFLATDLTVRIFGAPLARRTIFCVMLPALIISYCIGVLFFDTKWQGWLALSDFNLDVMRIACASFSAYVLGQLLDITVFNALRRLNGWWVAPLCSLVIGNIFDTFSFYMIAFYHSNDAYFADNLFQIACADYAFKSLVCILFFLPMYGVILNTVLRYLSQKGSQENVSTSITNP